MYHATMRCIRLKGRKKAFSICGINVESLLILPFPPVPSPSPKDREILICSENLITVIMYMPTSKRNAFASQSTQRLSDYTMCTLMSSCPSSITWHFSWPIPFPHLMQLQRDLWVWNVCEISSFVSMWKHTPLEVSGHLSKSQANHLVLRKHMVNNRVIYRENQLILGDYNRLIIKK